MPSRLVLTAAVGLATLACGSGTGSGGPAPDPGAARAAIVRQGAAFAAAVRTGDPDSMAAFYSADLVFLEPGYELHGRDSLRSLLKTVTVTTAFAGFVMEPEQYVDGTAQVAEFGRYRETMRDRKTGAETVCDCRYAVVWTKEADGVWRISRLHGGQSRLGPQ